VRGKIKKKCACANTQSAVGGQIVYEECRVDKETLRFATSGALFLGEGVRTSFWGPEKIKQFRCPFDVFCGGVDRASKSVKRTIKEFGNLSSL